MSQEALSRRQSPAEPAAKPVELHADLYREIFAHSKEAIAIVDPDGYYLRITSLPVATEGPPAD